MTDTKEMWTCPHCGHRFVTRHIWHSCGHYDLSAHFEGKEPVVREIFNMLVDLVEGVGPVTVYAQKTRIVMQARTRFASIVTRQRWLILQIWLKRQVDHPLLQRVEKYTYRDFGHIIRLRHINDIDEALEALLHEAYAMGSRA